MQGHKAQLIRLAIKMTIGVLMANSSSHPTTTVIWPRRVIVHLNTPDFATRVLSLLFRAVPPTSLPRLRVLHWPASPWQEAESLDGMGQAFYIERLCK